jgi:hypothetical protein
MRFESTSQKDGTDKKIFSTCVGYVLPSPDGVHVTQLCDVETCTNYKDGCQIPVPLMMKPTHKRANNND